MFALKMASIDPSPSAQSDRLASIRRGASTFFTPDAAIQSSTAGKLSGSASEGSQVSPGSLSAKKTACWPDPLAISRTRADAGSQREITSRIGARLRGRGRREAVTQAATLGLIRHWALGPRDGDRPKA